MPAKHRETGSFNEIDRERRGSTHCICKCGPTKLCVVAIELEYESVVGTSSEQMSGNRKCDIGSVKKPMVETNE